jgi:uncharacterized protein YndB with AHSA1/START domain
MVVLTRSQTIAAPIDTVFNTITDGGNFAAWIPSIRASRRLDTGELGNGTRFEWDLRGFGKVEQELQEFDRPRQVRIVPHIKQLAGGHRFRLTAAGNSTRIDHELEMRPKGAFILFTAMMGLIGRKNLRDTVNALQATSGEQRSASAPRQVHHREQLRWDSRRTTAGLLTRQGRVRNRRWRDRRACSP